MFRSTRVNFQASTVQLVQNRVYYARVQKFTALVFPVVTLTTYLNEKLCWN